MNSKIFSIALATLTISVSVPVFASQTRLVERTTVVAASDQNKAEKKCRAFAAKRKHLTFREVFKLSVGDSWECSYLQQVEVVYPSRRVRTLRR